MSDESSRCDDRLTEDSRLTAILVDGCDCEELPDGFLYVDDDSRRDDLVEESLSTEWLEVRLLLTGLCDTAVLVDGCDCEIMR